MKRITARDPMHIVKVQDTEADSPADDGDRPRPKPQGFA